MDNFLLYFLKINALLVLFYLVFHIFLKKETYFKNNRWFLILGLITSVVLPSITFTKTVYVKAAKQPVILFEDSNNLQPVLPTETLPLLSLTEIAVLIYGIIGFILIFKMLADLFKLMQIIKKSEIKTSHQFKYLDSKLVSTPFSFFNYIFFNSALITIEELNMITKHEEAHSRQKHSIDTLLVQLFVAIFWLNPVIWLYRKSIKQNLEYLADSTAISQVSDQVLYQKTMLRLTLQNQKNSIINTFNQSSIKKRIIMLNNNQKNRKSLWKLAIILPVLTIFMLLFQVKTIAKEKPLLNQESNYFSDFKNDFNNSENVLFKITKNTTNKELDQIILALKNKHHFSGYYKNLKRNSKNEIIAIILKINKNKDIRLVHEIIGNSPIDAFYIEVSKKDITIVNEKDVANGTEMINDDSFGIESTELENVNSENSKVVLFGADYKEVEKELDILNQNNEVNISFKGKNGESKNYTSTNQKADASAIYKINGNVVTKAELDKISPEEIAEVFQKVEEKNVNGKVVSYKVCEIILKNSKTDTQITDRLIFELANGDGIILFKNSIKIPNHPTINFNNSKNKIIVDEKTYSYKEFYNYNHKNLKSVNILTEFKNKKVKNYYVVFSTN